jgi:hypothetical protein
MLWRRRGSRMRVLTENSDKRPSFGGKTDHRFLLNCVNSDRHGGHLTNSSRGVTSLSQRPAWDLDAIWRGASGLYKSRRTEWYKGTATHYRTFLSSATAPLCVMLSGPHYRRIPADPAEHIEKKPSAARVVEVNLDERSRMGIMAFDETRRHHGIEENPKRQRNRPQGSSFTGTIKRKPLSRRVDPFVNYFAERRRPVRDKRRSSVSLKGSKGDVGVDSLWEGIWIFRPAIQSICERSLKSTPATTRTPPATSPPAPSSGTPS